MGKPNTDLFFAVFWEGRFAFNTIQLPKNSWGGGRSPRQGSQKRLPGLCAMATVWAKDTFQPVNRSHLPDSEDPPLPAGSEAHAFESLKDHLYQLIRGSP